MYNKRALNKDTKASKEPKKLSRKKDIIVDPMGQWNHPGQITRIPSNNITMQGVPYPVLGVGSTGQKQMMYPDGEYIFSGSDYVDEYPMMQRGGQYTPKERMGVRQNPDGSVSSHLMMSEVLPNGNWVSFPSLFQNEDGSWVDMSEKTSWYPIYLEALKRGEVYNFGKNKEAALEFGRGSWKKEYQTGGQKPILYVDPNDPEGRARYQAYADSLYVYNAMQPSYDRINNDDESYFLKNYRTLNAALARKEYDEAKTKDLVNHNWGVWSSDKVPYNSPKIIQKYNPAPEGKDEWKTDEFRTGTNWDKHFIDVEENSPIKPVSYRMYNMSDSGLGVNINGNYTGRGNNKNHVSFIANYKKPVQPVKYKPNPEIVAKQQQLIDAGYNIGKADGIWGPKSQAAWEQMQTKSEVPSLPNKKQTSIKTIATNSIPNKDVDTTLTKQIPKTQWKQLPNGTWYKDTKAGNKAEVVTETLYQKGGSIPKFQTTGQTPTYADSLALYNNALAKDAYYRNQKDYELLQTYPQSESGFTEENLKKAADQTQDKRDYYESHGLDSDPAGFPELTKDHLLDRIKQISNTLYSTSDFLGLDKYNNWVSDDPNLPPVKLWAHDSRTNPDAPPILYSPYILPQGALQYLHNDIYDLSLVPYYDPVMVKPWNMLTKKEKEFRRKVEKEGYVFTNPYPEDNSTGTTDPNISVDVRFRKLGLDSSFSNRKKVAEQAGIENYKGTAEQNKALNQWVVENYNPETKTFKTENIDSLPIERQTQLTNIQPLTNELTKDSTIQTVSRQIPKTEWKQLNDIWYKDTKAGPKSYAEKVFSITKSKDDVNPEQNTQFKRGGYIDVELDDEEIESYRKAGYGIEVITDPSLLEKISKEIGSNINPNWENEYFRYSPDRKKVWKTIPDRFKNFQQDIFNKYANEPEFRKVTTVWQEGGSLPKFQKTGQKYNIQKPKPIGYYQNILEPEVSESTAVENIFRPTEEQIAKDREHIKRVGDLTKAIKEETGVSHNQAVQNAQMIIENEMNNPQLSMQATPEYLKGKAQDEFSKKVLDDSWTLSDYLALPLDLLSTLSLPSDETRYQRRFRRYNPNTSALDKLKESTSEALSLAPSAALNVGLTMAAFPGAGTFNVGNVVKNIPSSLSSGFTRATGLSNLGGVLSTPAIIGGRTLPGVTLGNALDLYGVAQIPRLAKDTYTNLSEGKYWDAAATAGEGALYGLGFLNPMWKQGAKSLVDDFANTKIGNKIATGNSPIPYAWKVETPKEFVQLKNRYSLTDDEAEALHEYIRSPYAVKFNEKYKNIINNLAKSNPTIFDDVEKNVITRVIGHSSGAREHPTKYGSVFNYTPGATRSWSLGIDPILANTSRQRLVIPSKYSKDLKQFFAVPYNDPKLGYNMALHDFRRLKKDFPHLKIETFEDYLKSKHYLGNPTMNFQSEQELLGLNPFGWKVIGRANDQGFDNIFIKPLTKANKNMQTIASGSQDIPLFKDYLNQKSGYWNKFKNLIPSSKTFFSLPNNIIGSSSATIPFLGQESNTNSNVYKQGGSTPKFNFKKGYRRVYEEDSGSTEFGKKKVIDVYRPMFGTSKTIEKDITYASDDEPRKKFTEREVTKTFNDGSLKSYKMIRRKDGKLLKEYSTPKQTFEKGEMPHNLIQKIGYPKMF